ncbi:nitroreductase family protein [candidate division KSB1 bacterium]|nr:nitroreductase family protein [candidate division KSB1 bacterium]
MSIAAFIKNRRTIRRFQQTPIPLTTLRSLVDAARLAPSGANLQPLEYIVVEERDAVLRVFEHTRWAAYLPGEQGRPPQGQEPTAFIVLLINRSIRPEGGQHDAGAAMQNIILTALELGIGSCWLGSLDRAALTILLGIPKNYEIDTALALGYPDEQPVVEELTDSVKYYLDSSNRLHVPKRKLDSILHVNRYSQ